MSLNFFLPIVVFNLPVFSHYSDLSRFRFVRIIAPLHRETFVFQEGQIMASVPTDATEVGEQVLPISSGDLPYYLVHLPLYLHLYLPTYLVPTYLYTYLVPTYLPLYLPTLWPLWSLNTNFGRCITIPQNNHRTLETNFDQMSYNLPEDGDKLRWKMKKSEDEIWIVKPPGLFLNG